MPLPSPVEEETPVVQSTKFVSKRITPDKLTEFMSLARERFAYAKQADSEDRTLAEEDAKFAVATPLQNGGSTQWNPMEAEKRINASRPCLTENRLPTFTAQVVNDGRQRKPAIKISAMDNGKKETAEYYQGRIRQVEYECNADIAYDTVREQQVTSGRGFLRVTWEYVPRSVRKKRAKIEAIPNQFSVLFGPCKEYDCSDADYCFVISYITLEEHKRKHGTDTTAAHMDFAGWVNPAPDWIGTGPNARLIQEAEYWVKEYKPRTRVELSNGQEYWEDELETEFPTGLEAPGLSIVESREDQDCEVVQYVIDGADILDETVFIGPWIGIVPVWGREWFVDGKRRTSSLIRYAKDPQRLLNLYVSNIAEQIAQMPKNPYQVPVGGIPAGDEKGWENINTDPSPYRYYNQWDAQGRALNPPNRQNNEPPIMALVTGYHQAVDAIKAAMGLFDASIGNQSNETSSLAINARKRESDNANFHFHDNEARSRNHVGRILIHMETEFGKGKGKRAVRGEDGKVKMVMVGEPFTDETTGKTIHHDLRSADDYGVAVDTGPSYTSQRQEAAGAYGEIASHDKNFMTIAGDIYMRSLDMPGSEEIADRYEKMLPAPLAKQKPGADGKIPLQLAQQKIDALQQQAGVVIEQLTSELKRLQADEASQRVQQEFKLRIVEIQEKTKLEIALAELQQNEGLTVLKSDLAAIKHQLDLQQSEADRKHAAEQADLDRQTQAVQAQQAQAHQASLQDSAQAHQMELAQTPPPAPPAGTGEAAGGNAETGESGSTETTPQE